LPVEEIWVNVEEGARRTGYHLDHVRRLARESWRLPEKERHIRVRKDGYAYAIWLPDLINHLERRIPEDMQDDSLTSVEEIWVNSGEAAQVTGYSPQYITRLAMKMQKKPEQEREINLRKRSNRYEMWLPDLMGYMRTTKLGRPSKDKSLTPHES
jgi:hypothetical protein